MPITTQPYTVVGISDAGSFDVAGVFEGFLMALDKDPNVDTDKPRREAHHIWAHCPEAAEYVALNGEHPCKHDAENRTCECLCEFCHVTTS